MKTVQVKICGIQTKEIADAVIQAGADFLGFNFIPTSRHFIDPSEAIQIIQQLPSNKNVKIVGVFQDQSVAQVNAIAKRVGLDYVQLHGREDDRYIRQIEKPIIKHVTSTAGNYHTAYILLDRYIQGEGPLVDIDLARKLAQTYPVIVAGGLTPENVAEIITQVKPLVVDVTSGVESDGKHDITKIQQFIRHAKGVLL